MIAITLDYFGLELLHLFAPIGLSFDIGVYLWMMQLIRDVENDTTSFNEIAKSPKKSLSQKSKPLRHLIQFHSNVKQLSEFICNTFEISNSRLRFIFPEFRLVNDDMEITEPMLTAAFSWAICTLCGGMLLVQMQTVQ